MKKITQMNLWRHLSGMTGLLLVAILLSLAVVACGTDTATRSLPSSANATTSAATTAADSSATTAASGTTTSKPVQKVVQPGVAAQAATPSSDVTESNSVVDVVKKANPAVVTVYNKVKHSSVTSRFGNRTTPTTPNSNGSAVADTYVVQGIGSGVIISQDGYIVTNNHVVDGQENLTVALNDGKVAVPAKLIGQDKLGDIAVLKIDSPVPAFLTWADQAQVGETAVAIGAALGDFRNSVSKGVVSGLNRSLPQVDNNIYLQTDAAINHGNSGGPLLNLKGQIIGINTAVLRSVGNGNSVGSNDVAEGLGFAIPSYYAKLISDQLISKGSVTRPFFGISYQMITPADAGSLTANGTTVPAVEGAWVLKGGSQQAGVVSGSPADKAGVKENDVITAVDGEALNDGNPLMAIIMKHKPGDTVKLTVQRGSSTLNLSLTLVERPAGQ